MRRDAFTLVEVMIAVAIAVVLMLGVSQVFRTTSDTVGAGIASNDIARRDRNAQIVMYDDFRHSVPNPPLFIIANQNLAAYFNSNQAQSGVPLGTYRGDRLNFFTSGAPFRRTTADDPSLVNTTTPNDNWWGGYASPSISQEAYVCYGLLRLYNAAGTGTNYPGDNISVGSNNAYARDWVLGRNAFLLVDNYRIALGLNQSSTDQNLDHSPVWYEGQSTFDLQELTFSNYTILQDNYVLPRWANNQLCVAYGAQFTNYTTYYSSTNAYGPVNPATGQIYQFQNSRYDIAAVTSDQLRQDVYSVQHPVAGQTVPSPNWWNNLVFDPSGNLFLFECKPNFGKPLDPTAMALMSPYFVGHVSNFIVEYAGDYTTQDATDNVTAAVPDGQIDYDVINGVKSIRWYGLPRTPNMPSAAPVKPLQAWTGTPASWEMLSSANQYVCIWQNSAPPLVRVTFKVEDGSGHLQDGRWYSYVLSKPQ